MEDKISVLIIEDETLIAENIKMQLEDFGYNIAAVCYKYNTALNALESAYYDVIITDINLGNGIEEKSGLDLMMHIKKIKQCPFIFLTAFGDKDTIKKATTLYPSAYLIKPINQANLYAALQLAVENFNNSKAAEKPTEDVKPDYFFTKLGNKMIKIFWKDIYHLESFKNYVCFKTPEYKYGLLFRGSLKQVMQVMMPQHIKERFVKINRREAILKSIITIVHTDSVLTPFGSFKLSSDIDKNQL